MKERPILFSGQMVRAILEGRKTQTRRIVKPQPTKDYVTLMPLSGELVGVTKHGGPIDNRGWLHCPYGKPGDRLWVRETWGKVHYEGVDESPTIFYRADERDQERDELTRWRPSIHMPRWASRINLEVVSVRVERLQDISEEDAMSEGIESWEERGVDDAQDYYRDYVTGGHVYNAKDSFRSLWQSINGPGSWEANPWVWVVEFKRIEP
jgi:hypothetical protein